MTLYLRGMERNTDWISDARFSPYRREADGDDSVAWALYEWNARIASTLSECIHHAEVILRNSMVRNLGKIHPMSYPWNTDMPAVVAAAKRRARSGGATSDDVISELTLGFWMRFLEQSVENDELWRHHLKDAFPFSPGTRQSVLRAVSDMRDLRNRCAHQDSLLESDPAIELKKLLRLVEWIDPTARSWIESLERVSGLASERPVRPPRDVVVFPIDDTSELMYNAVSAYVCPQERSFAPVEYVGFYKDKKILGYFAKVKSIVVPSRWSVDERKRLASGGSEDDKALARVMGFGLQNGWRSGEQFQVFFLSGKNDPDTLKRSEEAPIVHQRSGRGSAFVRRHRYFAHSALLAAHSTDDLNTDHGE